MAEMGGCCTMRRHPVWRVAIISGILVPPLIKEGGEFVKQLPQYKNSLLQHLPPSGPVRDTLDRMLSGSKFSNPGPMLEKVIVWGGSGLEVLAGFLAMLVLAVYFVSDGTTVYKWLAAFLPRDKRQQLDNSTGEITSVVSRYVGGSALTAMICGVYAFTVLSILGVPNAALLAVVAAFFDLLAIIGFLFLRFRRCWWH
jgi:predicted PurR-regulated permease PerM